MSITKSVSFEDSVFDNIRKEQKKNSDGFSKTVNILLKKKTMNFDKKGNCKAPLNKGKNEVTEYNGKVYNLDEGKKCSKCEEWKPFSEYYKDKTKKKEVDGFGYMSQCKVCKENKK